ncbi:hypothetical protein MNBD_GAMMA25-1590 [hydrothermal vent metagenome]|uniref:Uncharacterized protein n=1 Tax=hydrothermal vent metagenome TaxID=652676 RepID=A0A3B1C379_9ZZZZ
MHRFLLFSLLSIIPPSVSATNLYEFLDPIPQDNSLWLEYSSGLEDSRNFYGELDLAVSTDQHLLLGAGKSDVLTFTKRVELYSFMLGYNSAYGEPFEFGLVYDYWGNTNELWTNSLSVPLRWNTRDWSLSLQPQLMKIYLYTRRFNQPQRRHSSDSRSLSGSVNYYGFVRWELGVTGSKYYYQADMERLDNPLARFLFSDVTLVLSYGFPRSRLAGNIAYNFDSWRLGIKQEQTISAVDASQLDITSVNANFYLSDDFSLLIEGGYISIENAEPYNYIKLGTRFFF